MKARTRITLLFTFITAGILVGFAAVVYLSANKDREREFYSLLEKEAYTKANLFLDARVESKTLQDIYRSNREILNEVEVAIYDLQGTLLYHDDVALDFVKETPDMLAEIAQSGALRFYQDRWQVVGLLYPFASDRYLITAAAYDDYGFRKMQSLLQNMVLVLLASLLIIYFSGRYIAHKAFQPVQTMTERAREITSTHLHVRLHPGDGRDELSQLAATFNDMLERLEHSFEAQKSFVSNISHELRTPMAAIIAELELALGKNLSDAQHQEVISNTLNDARKLVRLSNSLLDLARAHYDASEIAFAPVRIDEVLLDALTQIHQVDTGYKAAITFGESYNPEIHGTMAANEYLLKTAFVNLFENGCKYSPDKRCTATLFGANQTVFVRFENGGPGIDPADLPHLFTPFYRGQNKHLAHGYGIGLPLARRIIALHGGIIAVESAPGLGASFTVSLPG